MTQNEFLRELEQALRGNVSEKVIQDNLRYYRGYIEEQIAAGRVPEEVIMSLGSPRLIARTIIDTTDRVSGGFGEKEESGFRLNSAWTWFQEIIRPQGAAKYLVILAVIFVVLLVLSLVLKLIGFLFKPAMVILAIAVVYYVVSGIRNKKF